MITTNDESKYTIADNLRRVIVKVMAEMLDGDPARQVDGGYTLHIEDERYWRAKFALDQLIEMGEDLDAPV